MGSEMCIRDSNRPGTDRHTSSTQCHAREATRASSKSQGEAATRTAEILDILAWTATPQISPSEGPPSCAAGVPFCRASTRGQLQTQQQQGHRTRTARSRPCAHMNREGLPARLPAQSPAGGGGCARHALPARRVVQSPSVGCPHGRRPCWRWASMFCRGNPADAASMRSDAAACTGCSRQNCG